MMISTVTPIKVFRNEKGELSRSLNRIEYQLQSLRAQKTPYEIFPVISDMTEDLETAEAIKAICQRFGARYVHTPSTLIWNKSLCLNIGIKATPPESDFVATLDVDIIYREDVFTNAADLAQRRQSEAPVILCQTFGYNEEKWTSDYSVPSFKRALENGRFLHLAANGGLQFFDRSWLMHVRGYDERYNLWGGIDNEIVKRAEANGKRIIWLSRANSEIYLIHLHHSKWNIPGVSHHFISKYRRRVNHSFYKKRPIKVIPNFHSWGEEQKVNGPRWKNGKIIVNQDNHHYFPPSSSRRKRGK